MYCPKCGRLMSVNEGWYTGLVGGVQLSQHVEKSLGERFPEQKPRIEPAVVGYTLLRSFCPGCGIPLDREMKCRSCGKSTRDLLFPLIELHPSSIG